MLIGIAIAGVVTIIVLGVWNRAIARRAPRWVSIVAVLAQIAVAVGVGTTCFGVRGSVESLGDVNPAERQAMLAQGIGHAMYGTAIAFACALVAAVVLAWATLRRADDA